jgi:perosamine synthetase
MIPIYRPYIKKYTQSAENQLRAGWISNHGKFVDLTAKLMCQILDVRYCILMNTGTAATECLLQALFYMYPQIKRIYIPDFVFITPWSLSYQYFSPEKITPLKVNPVNMNMDTCEEYLMSLEKEAAIFCVHNLGSIVNIPRIKRIRPDLKIIEDNCEGLFGMYEGIYTGTSKSSIASACSFYGNKIITSGEGGAFFTNNSEIYEYILKYYSHGMTDIRYIHDIPGKNYRMTNIQASLLYEQLLDIKHILFLKRKIIVNYERLINSLIHEVKTLSTESDTHKSNWMMTIILSKGRYEELEKYMLDHKIEVRPFFYSISKHLFLDKIENKNLNSIMLNNSYGVILPSYPDLTMKEQEHVINILDKYLNGC